MSDDVVAFGSPGDWEYLEGAYAEIRALLEERNLSLAADRCGRLLQDYPDEADAHALMGDICAARQQWAEAVEWYALAEQRGAGPEVSRRRAAAEAMVPRPVPTPSLPQPTPDLHRQRTRILAIFGAATAVVIVAVVIALLALSSGTPSTAPRRVPRPAEPAPALRTPATPGSGDRGGGNLATTAPATPAPVAIPAPPVPGQGVAAPSASHPPVVHAPVIITRRMDVPATDEDYIIARAVGALTWPDGSSMSGDVSVMMDPYQAYCVLTFRIPDTLPAGNLADMVVQQAYRAVAAAMDADAAISAITVRALGTITTKHRQPTTLQAFRANLSREALNNWRQALPNPTAQQLREQVFAAVWWNPAIPQDTLR